MIEGIIWVNRIPSNPFLGEELMNDWVSIDDGDCDCVRDKWVMVTVFIDTWCVCIVCSGGEFKDNDNNAHLSLEGFTFTTLNFLI